MVTLACGKHRHSDFARRVGLAVAVGLHGVAIGVLLAWAPAREAMREAAPLMVDLIPSSPPAQPKPQPKVDALPKPMPVRPVAPRPEPQPAVLAANAPAADAPAVNVPVEPRPQPPVEAKPASPAPPTPAPTVVPPSFQADYLDNPAPAYPALSRRSGEQGRVLLRVQVEANGLPTNVEVRTSSGYERLDQAALDAVRRWKFVPARLGDKAVAAFVVVPIQFNLRN